MSESPTLYQRISREFFYLEILSRTARDIGLNHLYFDLNDARPITLLDFDIVYGSLLSMTRSSPSLASRYGAQFDLLNTIPAFGTVQLKKLLPPVDHYTFPPGAEVELYRWIKIILGKLDGRYERLMADLERAKRSSDPVGYLMNLRNPPKGMEVIDLLQSELSELHDLTTDSKLLDLLRQKWLPCNELLGDHQEAASTVAYKIVLSRLNVERSNLTYNNFNDALNAGYAVKVFNSGGLFEGRKVVPTLISGTEPIATLDLSRFLVGPQHDLRPKLFGSVLYFSLSQNLKCCSDGSNRQIADLADQIFKRTLNLSDQYKEVIATVRRRCPSLSDESLNNDPVVRDSIAALESAKQEFRTRHSYIPHDNPRQLVSDKVALLNQIITQKIRTGFETRSPFLAKSALQELMQVVRFQDASGQLQFWTGTPEVYTIKNNLPTSALEEAAFSLTISKSVPDTLAETLLGEPIETVSNHDWSALPYLFLLCHPRNIGALAVIRMEIHGRGDDQYEIKLRWAHELDCYTVWSKCYEIAKCLSAEQPPTGTMTAFSHDGKQMKKSGGLAQCFELLDDALKSMSTVTRGSIALNTIAISAHFEPVTDYEKQIELTLPYPFESAKAQMLSELISDTIEPSISAFLVQRILKVFIAKSVQLLPA